MRTSLRRREGHFQKGERLGAQGDEWKGNEALPEGQARGEHIGQSQELGGERSCLVREATERAERAGGTGVRQPAI